MAPESPREILDTPLDFTLDQIHSLPNEVGALRDALAKAPFESGKERRQFKLGVFGLIEGAYDAYRVDTQNAGKREKLATALTGLTQAIQTQAERYKTGFFAKSIEEKGVQEWLSKLNPPRPEETAPVGGADKIVVASADAARQEGSGIVAAARATSAGMIDPFKRADQVWEESKKR